VNLDDSASNRGHRKELKRLTEQYALRSRELAEAVAALGSLIATDRPIEQAIADIVRLRILSEQSGTELFLFVKRMQERAASAGPGAGTAPAPWDDTNS
jgi:hypothetical protein